MKSHYIKYKGPQFIPEEQQSMKWNNNTVKISIKQLAFIEQLRQDFDDAGYEIDIDSECRAAYNKTIKNLSMSQASEFIDALLAERRYFELSDHIGD